MTNPSEKLLTLNYTVPISESGMMDNDFIIQGIAINATVTANNHKFLSEELRESASSLNGVPLLVDHKNEISAIKGRVLKGEFDEANNRINFRAKVVDSDVKRMIKDGLINSVSVGAAVREIEEAGDVLIPHGITFKELSLVAVPADSCATFATAMFKLHESMKLNSTESSQTPKVDASLEASPSQEVAEQMVKCPECDKMIDKKGMAKHMADKHPKNESNESLSSKEESQSMKGGIKMSEEKVAEKVEQVDLGPLVEAIKILADKVTILEKSNKSKEAKEVIKEVREEKAIEEKSRYNIVQSHGSLRGHSFSLVR